ncbi:MAG: hypothetical protein V4671_28175 [Armatimonadota bacterium]
MIDTVPVSASAIAAFDGATDGQKIACGESRIQARESKDGATRKIGRDDCFRFRPAFTLPGGTPAPELTLEAIIWTPGTRLQCLVVDR